MAYPAHQPPEVRIWHGEKSGAIAAFPFDRMTIERFKKDFPQARWRDDLSAWFVPGSAAERRLNRWFARELAGAFAFADERGRDAFAFDPIESAFLDAGDDLILRTPYSRTVLSELRAIAWAQWDDEIKAWRIPYRSLEQLLQRWDVIEAAALRNLPEARQRRRAERSASGERSAAIERRRHRFPVPADDLPPSDRVVMTARFGAVVFLEFTGELVDEEVRRNCYGEVAANELIWAHWRKPSLAELIKTWPSRSIAPQAERRRGWWRPDLEELRSERRAAKSRARAQTTRNSKK